MLNVVDKVDLDFVYVRISDFIFSSEFAYLLLFDAYVVNRRRRMRLL